MPDGELEYLAKGVDTVLAPHWVSFVCPKVTVGSQQYTNSVMFGYIDRRICVSASGHVQTRGCRDLRAFWRVGPRRGGSGEALIGGIERTEICYFEVCSRTWLNINLRVVGGLTGSGECRDRAPVLWSVAKTRRTRGRRPLVGLRSFTFASATVVANHPS
jgi:hypothetical protein